MTRNDMENNKMIVTVEMKASVILCQRRSRKISYVHQSDINEYFVTKYGSDIPNSRLQTCAKFQTDI